MNLLNNSMINNSNQVKAPFNNSQGGIRIKQTPIRIIKQNNVIKANQKQDLNLSAQIYQARPQISDNFNNPNILNSFQK